MCYWCGLLRRCRCLLTHNSILRRPLQIGRSILRQGCRSIALSLVIGSSFFPYPLLILLIWSFVSGHCSSGGCCQRIDIIDRSADSGIIVLVCNWSSSFLFIDRCSFPRSSFPGWSCGSPFCPSRNKGTR